MTEDDKKIDERELQFNVICKNGRYGIVNGLQFEMAYPIYDEILIEDGIAKCRIWKDIDYFSTDFGYNIGYVRYAKPHDKTASFRMSSCYGFTECYIEKRIGYDNIPVERVDNCYLIYNPHSGKFGIKDKRKQWILPCEYDEIKKWRECNVIFARKGAQRKYYTTMGKEILTEPRYKQYYEPFFLEERNRYPYLVSMEYYDDFKDPNACFCYGHCVRLDQIPYKDVTGIVSPHCEYIEMPEEGITYFEAENTYLYSAYMAHSRRKNPLNDCMDKLEQLQCLGSDWRRLFKIWTNVNTHLTEDEISAAKEKIRFGHVYLGYGIDDTLRDGEVKVMLVNFFGEFYNLKLRARKEEVELEALRA
jgi:hypothetical protein